MIFESALVLLEAGLNPNSTKPLDALLKQTRVSTMTFSGYDAARFNSHKALLVADLVELLLKHGAHPTQGEVTLPNHCEIFTNAANLVRKYELGERRFEDDYNTILECMGAMFRCLLLARTGVDQGGYFPDGFVDRASFPLSFASIAGFASRCGHSKKLIRLVLDTMSANQVIRLKDKLSKRLNLTDPTVAADINRTSLVSAIEFLDGLHMPFRLEHLARLSILSTMSYCGIRNSSSLGLAKFVEQYVLFLRD